MRLKYLITLRENKIYNGKNMPLYVNCIGQGEQKNRGELTISLFIKATFISDVLVGAKMRWRNSTSLELPIQNLYLLEI